MSPKTWMKQNDRTQRQVAQSLKCSVRTLRRRLAGTHPWPLEEAIAFVKLTARSKRPLTVTDLTPPRASERSSPTGAQ